MPSTAAEKKSSGRRASRGSSATRGAKAPKTSTGARRANGAQRAAPARRSKIEVRQSAIHGRGVYAARDLKKGERIIEYTGRIISWKEADRVPPSDPDDPNHTFLFSLADGKRVIDASGARNAARWINHSCDPNCETEETEDGRVFIEALRDIPRGEELHYDYCLVIDEKLTKKLKREYRCLCGAPDCRGTMLADEGGKKKKKKKKKK
jgi:SET domain-containing protein